MGYDCTLHAIDPASFARFEAWLLDGAAAPKFAKAFADTDAIRAEVIAKLAATPREAGKAVLEACLMFCSTEAPHLDSRGFCLGLWHKLELGPADDLPSETQSALALAQMLPRVAAQHPGARLFTGIDGNYALGHYIPVERVAVARVHLEARLDEVSVGWVDALDKAIRVLRVCEQRGLAYWEATDLGVANANAKWLVEKPAKPAKPKKGAIPDGVRATQLFESARLMHVKHGIAIAGSVDRSVVVDWRGAAPIVKPIETGTLWLQTVRELPDGRVATLARPAVSAGAARIAPGLSVIDLETGTLRGLPNPPGWTEVSWFEVAGDKVVLFPERTAMFRRAQTPRYLDGEAIVLPPDLPASSAGTVVGLGDGSLLLVAGATLRVAGTQVERLPLAIRLFNIGEPPQGLAVPDGVLVAVDHDKAYRLVKITLDGRVTEPWPELTTAYPAQPARDGALILKQQETADRDLLKIYWSATDEVTSVPVSWTRQKRQAWSFAYDPGTDELWLTCQAATKQETELVRIPWRLIEELPRFTHDGYRAHLAELASAKAKRDQARSSGT